MKFNSLLTAAPLVLLVSLSAPLAATTWEERFYNPAPLDDDIILPMPCDGAMVFRKIPVIQHALLDDQRITLGQDSSEWGYLEQSRAAYISGSFPTSEQERYYLLAKYELSELQYQALLNKDCPAPSMKLRLPAVSYSWMDAIHFADQYNLWLREHHLDLLPKDDDEYGFVRLPLEEEWEYAARGGATVDSAAFRESRYPMSTGLNDYEWYAGAQSSNNKLQLTGLLKPNPLGLHDMLGNANEMMLEPFRLNKLNRLHGQAGGMIVRGGSFQTPQSQIRTAERKELPYYHNTAYHQAPTTGMRFVVVSPALSSRDRVNQIAEEWQSLGSGTEQEGNAVVVQSLQEISTHVVDDALKNQLKELENQLRSSNEMQAEARNQAILASLNLGAFLCTKLKDDGLLTQNQARVHHLNCGSDMPEENATMCTQYAVRLQEQQQRLEGIKRYYASSLVESASLYGHDLINQQVPVMYQKLAMNKQISALTPYVKAYWGHQKNYFETQQINTDQWLESCIHVN